MKKKILIIALVCILAGVAAFYIVKVMRLWEKGMNVGQLTVAA